MPKSYISAQDVVRCAVCNCPLSRQGFWLMLESKMLSPETAFFEWCNLFEQTSRASAGVHLAAPGEHLDVSRDVDEAWARLGAYERRLIGTRWASARGAIVKLKVALAHARQMSGGEEDLDQNWRLVTSAFSDLVGGSEKSFDSIPSLAP